MFYSRIQLFYSKLVNTLLSSSLNKDVFLNIITKTSPRSTQILESLLAHLVLIQESSQKHINKRDKEKSAHLSSLEHQVYVTTNLIKMQTLLSKLQQKLSSLREYSVKSEAT